MLQRIVAYKLKKYFFSFAFDNVVQYTFCVIGLLSHKQPSEGHGIILALKVPCPQVSVLLPSSLIHSFPFIIYTQINSSGILVSQILRV